VLNLGVGYAKVILGAQRNRSIEPRRIEKDFRPFFQRRIDNDPQILRKGKWQDRSGNTTGQPLGNIG
jgi:hypothetical protein